jgi:hypothetical protein
MPNKAIWYSVTLAFNDEAMLAFSYWKVEIPIPIPIPIKQCYYY